MEIGVFKKYKNGYYYFEFDNGSDMVFEEVHPKVLYKYNLKTDTSLIDKQFELKFSESFEDTDDNFVIYRIESLKLI